MIIDVCLSKYVVSSTFGEFRGWSLGRPVSGFEWVKSWSGMTQPMPRGSHSRVRLSPSKNLERARSESEHRSEETRRPSGSVFTSIVDFMGGIGAAVGLSDNRRRATSRESLFEWFMVLLNFGKDFCLYLRNLPINLNTRMLMVPEPVYHEI